MADMNLGGSRYANLHEAIVTDPQTLQLYEYRPRLVQWAIIPTGADVVAVVSLRVPSGRTVTPVIYNVTDATVDAVGTAVTSASTPVDAEGFFEQSIDIPRPGNGLSRVYELRFVLESGAVADDVRVFGTLRIEF